MFQLGLFWPFWNPSVKGRNMYPTLVVWGVPIRFNPIGLTPSGGAKGLEFRSWCEKCLGSGGVPLPVAGGRRGCLDNEHEYWDDQRGTVRISTEQCLIARPGFPGTFPGSAHRWCTQTRTPVAFIRPCVDRPTGASLVWSSGWGDVRTTSLSPCWGCLSGPINRLTTLGWSLGWSPWVL